MDHLISQLQQKIDSLSMELEAKRDEVKQLKRQIQSLPSTHTEQTLTQNSAATDLLQQHLQSNGALTPSQQLQLYIEDSLDLLTDQTTTYDLNPTSALYPAQPDTLEIDIGMEMEMEISHTPSTTMATSIDEQIPAKPIQKNRQKNLKNNRRLIQMLEKRYPKAFNWHNPKPLKIGIDKDIQTDDELTPSKLRHALAAYTRSNRYKQCLTTKQDRIDLNGQTQPQNSPIKAKTAKQTPSALSIAKNDANPSTIKPNDTQETEATNSWDNLTPEQRLQAKLKQLINKGMK